MARREFFLGGSRQGFYIQVVRPFTDEELRALDLKSSRSYDDKTVIGWTWSDLAMNSHGVQIMGFEQDRFSGDTRLFTNHAKKLAAQIGSVVVHQQWHEVDVMDVVPNFVPINQTA